MPSCNVDMMAVVKELGVEWKVSDDEKMLIDGVRGEQW